MSEIAMEEFLTVAKQPFMMQRFVRYFTAAWIVGGTMASAQLATLRDAPATTSAILWRFPALFFLGFGFVLWAGYLSSFDAQLSPANVQLVPGLKRNVRATAIAVWAWMSAFLGFEMVPFGVPLAIGIALTAAGFAVSASRSGYVRALSAVIFTAILVLCSYPFRWAPPLWAGMVALVVSVGGGGFWLAREIGSNPEKRALPYERLRRNMRRVREPSSEETGYAAFLRRAHLEDWAFARLLRQPSPAERSLQGLGSTFHWERAAIASSVATILSFLVYYATVAIPARLEGDDPRNDRFLMSYPFNMAFVFTALLATSYLRELWFRRKEEALLVLLPGSPRPPQLNGWLMRSLLARFAVAVLVTYGVASGIILVLGLPFTSILTYGSAPLAASFFVPPLFLRDYAAMNRPLPVGLLAVPGIGLIVAQVCIMVRSIALDPTLVLAVGVALGPILLAIRYTQLTDARPALPVGRSIG